MGLDFNEAEPRRRDTVDLDDLSARLGAVAEVWAPALFPSGRIGDGELRLANIQGDPPRKQGSCVIALTGAHAGSWKDFSISGAHGGPLSTLKNATGLEGAALIDRALELVGGVACAPKKPNGNGNGAHAKPDRQQEIAHILAHSVQALDSPIALAYFASRKLKLPDGGCDDLLFNPDATDWKTRTGWPALVAIVRNSSGERLQGVHRTYLARDGSGKAPLPKAKKMIGAIEGGAVRLAPLGADGVLGVSEGIESGLAAMMLFEGVPVWAALSTSGMMAFGLPLGLKRLMIFADAGRGGLDAAETLRARAEAVEGVTAEILIPRSGDDFNADLIAGFTAPDSAPQSAPPSGQFLTPAVLDVTDTLQRIFDLRPETPADQICGLIREVISSGVNNVAVSQALIAIKTRTHIPINDLKALARQEQTRLAIVSAPGGGGGSGGVSRRGQNPEWIGKIIRTESGEPKALLHNAVVALQEDEAWKGVIALDGFAMRPTMRQPAPWMVDALNGSGAPFLARPWTDNDDFLATCWLQQAGIHLASPIVHEAVQVAAEANRYHPVREYLDGLQWDGIPRCDGWAAKYLGAKDTPFTRAAGARWLISGVARIYRPGIKADHMMVLEGTQDLGKSTAIRILADPWFTDEIPDIGSKDSSLQMVGVWIMEFAEMDAMRRADISRLKAFLTRTTDRYRPPFGRHAIDQPRSCIFAGSINDWTYLNDPTGARRFWPVHCSKIDQDGLWEARDQLWAEAVVRFNAGEAFYLHETGLKAEARVEQSARQQEDAWDSLVEAWLRDSFGKSDVSIAEVLAGIMVPRDRWDRIAQSRVAAYLQKNKWERYKSQQMGWRYKAPDALV